MATLKTKDIIAQIESLFEAELTPEDKEFFGTDNQSNWKQTMKRTVEFDNVSHRPFSDRDDKLEPIVLLDGQCNWRIFKDFEDEYREVFVIDNDEEVLLIDHYNPLVPFNKFDFALNINLPLYRREPSVRFALGLNKEKYPENVNFENEIVNKNSIIGFEEELFKLGYSIETESSYPFSGTLYKIKEGTDFKDVDKFENQITFKDIGTIKEIFIRKFKMKYNSELETIIDEEYQ